MKSIAYFVVGLAFSGCVAAQNSSADPQSPTGKLGVFVGKWQSEGAFLDTPYSKAGKVTSEIDCSWSPQHNFLICEQAITDSTGKHTQLSIFSYNGKEGSYAVSSVAGPGAKPWNGTVIIDGNIWTYPGGYEANGKKITIKTTNDFSVPGTETFKTQFSDDGGVHWVTTLQGSARKVAS